MILEANGNFHLMPLKLYFADGDFAYSNGAHCRMLINEIIYFQKKRSKLYLNAADYALKFIRDLSKFVLFELICSFKH